MHYTTAKGILSAKNGMNLYRGCSHGCIYCDSRSHCYQMAHDFEDIEVKENALTLLEHTLRHKRKKCMIGTGSMSDPYMPLEKDLQYTRKALELIYNYGFGATLITKSNLVLRDIDLLKKFNTRTKCVVQMTLTTFDESLCKKLEPKVCTTKTRFEVLKALHSEGIPTVVWLSPILPMLNDNRKNIEGILQYCIKAKVYGVICFGMGLTLREGNREYFYDQLDLHFPNLKQYYMQRYGNQYMINSPRNRELMQIYHRLCEENHILHNNNDIFQYLQTFTEKEPLQPSLF